MTSASAKLNWKAILFLGLTPILTILLLTYYFFTQHTSWGIWVLFVIFFSLNNLSITIGYHRYFSHRSFEAHPVLKFILLFISTGAFQGTVLQWATDHRRHHLKIDSNEDPYNINRGFWYAHMGWMFFDDTEEYKNKFAPDLTRDKWLVFQHHYYPYLSTFIGFGVPTLVGMMFSYSAFESFLILGLLRVVLTQHSTFFINSLCHFVGNRPYSDEITARDSVIMAFLTFGEGYHNYHHKFQIDYRNGVRWYQWDPSKWTIQFCKLIGLADKLKTIPSTEIFKAKMQRDEKSLLEAGAQHESILALKQKIETAQIRLKQVKMEYRQEYKNLKRNMNLKHEAQMKKLKADLKLAKLEWKNASRQWLIYTKIFGVTKV